MLFCEHFVKTKHLLLRKETILPLSVMIIFQVPSGVSPQHLTVLNVQSLNPSVLLEINEFNFSFAQHKEDPPKILIQGVKQLQLYYLLLMLQELKTATNESSFLVAASTELVPDGQTNFISTSPLRAWVRVTVA